MDSSTFTGSKLTQTVSYFTTLIRLKLSCGLEWILRKHLLGAMLGLVCLSISPVLESSSFGQNEPDTAQQVTINFDNLPTNTLVTNQYAQVKLSGTGFSGGQGGPQGHAHSIST